MLSAAVGPVMTAPDMSNPHAFMLYPAQNSSTGPATLGLNRLIGGIISYVRWPDARPPNERQFCVVGTPQLADNLRPALPGNGTMTVVHRSAREVALSEDCDVLYLGKMPTSDRQRLMGWVRDKPVLTITDADPSCSYGSMFCVTPRRQAMTFAVNLDAIGRGPLRVDPRVLRIGRDG